MYTDHYGLNAAPFQLTPDGRFYFESRTHKKAMAYLGFGLTQGEGFIVITGDVGARHLVGQHADRLVEVEMPDDGVLRDFDTAEALKDSPGFGPRG